VWKLAPLRNTVSPVIPENSIRQAPSAELRPGRSNTDRCLRNTIISRRSLPDYGVDRLLWPRFATRRARPGGSWTRCSRLGDGPNTSGGQSAPGTKISCQVFG